jgi:hypothetical protein
VRLRQPLQRLLRASSNRLHIAGAELGCWSFLGNALASLGLSLTTATKAAFLTQVRPYKNGLLPAACCLLHADADADALEHVCCCQQPAVHLPTSLCMRSIARTSQGC